MSLQKRDVAQSGSALRSGRRSREFKSPHPDILLDVALIIGDRRPCRISANTAGAFLSARSRFRLEIASRIILVKRKIKGHTMS